MAGAVVKEQDAEASVGSTDKKTNKNQIEDCNEHMTLHKFHMSKLNYCSSGLQEQEWVELARRRASVVRPLRWV